MKAKSPEMQTTVAGSDSLETVNATCKILKIGPTKCWNLISKGELEAVRLGSRCTRVRHSSIGRLIANGETK